MQRFISIFLYTEQKNTAHGVGKSRVGFPQAFGQPSQRFFRLDAIVLPVHLDIG